MLDKKDNLPVVLKAKEHFIKVFGTATTLEERKEALQYVKKHLHPKAV